MKGFSSPFTPLEFFFELLLTENRVSSYDVGQTGTGFVGICPGVIGRLAHAGIRPLPGRPHVDRGHPPALGPVKGRIVPGRGLVAPRGHRRAARGTGPRGPAEPGGRKRPPGRGRRSGFRRLIVRGQGKRSGVGRRCRIAPARPHSAGSGNVFGRESGWPPPPAFLPGMGRRDAFSRAWGKKTRASELPGYFVGPRQAAHGPGSFAGIPPETVPVRPDPVEGRRFRREAP